MGKVVRIFARLWRRRSRLTSLDASSLRDALNSKPSWTLSRAEIADLCVEARSPQRRAELARAAWVPVPVSPAQGLRQLWDLLDLLSFLAGPLPPDRFVDHTHAAVL